MGFVVPLDERDIDDRGEEHHNDATSHVPQPQHHCRVEDVIEQEVELRHCEIGCPRREQLFECLQRFHGTPPKMSLIWCFYAFWRTLLHPNHSTQTPILSSANRVHSRLKCNTFLPTGQAGIKDF